ncbi:SH3 domain-containing protein [Tamlana sp. I1]|uniref:SH3 domain-containing protein n=1 Tax=Tamlana sp. I1 TaxID=2762061 RepID=UPI00188F1223|nr:SH3 domain-containing protein [Tamlana sp. I1]
MKQILYYLITLIFLFSCHLNIKEEKKSAYSQSSHKKDSISQIKYSSQENDIRYVNAENGLNYRDTPKGNVIGKLPYNTKLNIIGTTGVYKEILDEGEILKGEWVSILVKKDTVYVFSAFLSLNKDVSDLQEENEFFIKKTDDLFKTNPYVSKLVNDSVIIKEIPVNSFMSVRKIQKDGYKTVSKEYKNLSNKEQIKKIDSVITLKCLNNKILMYKDTNPDDDWEIETYYYLGTFENINSYLIEKNGYEWSSYLLINKNSCEFVEYLGYPVFNSDNSKIITVDTDSYKVSEFVIYSLDNKEYKLTHTFTLDIEVSDFVFNDDNLYIEYGVEWSDGKTQKKSFQYFILKFL